MYRIITVEREYASGAAEIAFELANRLGWKLWDHALTEEIAKLARVDCSAVESREERMDSTFQRLAKVFWRGSYERSMPQTGGEIFDADCMVRIGQEVMEKAAEAGNGVIVGRGAPYFLRERADTFRVFLYAAREEKVRRLLRRGRTQKEAEDLVDTVDRERMEFVSHYFGADWPTRYLYHMMINTAIGSENVISTILETMHLLEKTLVRT